MRFLKNCLAGAAFVGLSACALTPSEPSATGDYLAGRLAAKKNAVDVAAAAYSDALEDFSSSAPLLQNAFFYSLAAGDIETAARLARSQLASEANDNDGLARTTLAAVAIKNGNYKEARRIVGGPFDAPFLNATAFLTDVWIEDALNGSDAALARLNGNDAGVFKGFHALHEALLAQKKGDDGAALLAHQKSVFGLGGPVGRVAYGAFLERTGDAQAVRDYYGLLARERGEARRIADAGLSRLENGRPSSAFQNVDASQGVAIAYYTMAHAILDQTVSERVRAERAGFNVGEPRFNLPLSLSQLALYLDPELDQARNLAGRIYNEYGDFDAARAMLSAIPASSPLYEVSQIYIASGYAVREENDKAISVLKAVVDEDPSAIDARTTLVNFYAAENRHEEAVALADSIIAALGDEADESAWRYYVARGGSLNELGRWESAEKDLKKAVELAPEEPTTLNYLGYTWAERGVNLEEAFDLIEKAVELQPGSGAITDSLGWAYYQRGNYQEAVKHLELAASLEPSDPTITDHLGDVYWRLGRKIEAKYEWRRVLELDPPAKLKASVNKKIADGLGAVTPGAGAAGDDR